MHPFQAQIDRETAKVKLLRGKIEECEKRIAMLRSMREDDALDKLLDQELRTTAPTAPTPVTQPQAPADNEIKPRRKPIPENWSKLLAFIGEDGKSSDQVRAFLTDSPIGITPDASRTGLMNFRKEYGFVDSPRRGFYKLSPLGAEAIRAQQSESPDIWR